VYRYSVRPAESVSQIPALPLAVFKTNVEPEAVEPEAVEPGAAEAVVVGVGPVVVVPLAADVLDALLQAVASIATAASGRPKPNVRSEVLRSITILPCRCGPIADPHVTGTHSIRTRCRKGLNRALRQKSPSGLMAELAGYRSGRKPVTMRSATSPFAGE
jgi:hypothetical protein